MARPTPGSYRRARNGLIVGTLQTRPHGAHAEGAAAFVDDVGLALLLPKADVVLPSLWEQVNGSPERSWAVREADGTFVRWSDEMSFLWGAKDELPQQGSPASASTSRGRVACIAPRLVAGPRRRERCRARGTALAWPRRSATPAR